MPDTPRYVTLRSGLYVQVLDLGPVQECLPAKTIATCADSTSAATVALALNLAHEHDADEMADTIRSLDAAIYELMDRAGDLGPGPFAYYEAITSALQRHEARQ